MQAKYFGETAKKLSFAKPKKKDGLYALVKESTKFFYDRFYLEIDTYCFCCHKKIKGKASEFPKQSISSDSFAEFDLEDKENTAYFCSYDCKATFYNNLRYEGEFQAKEIGSNGNTFGYIYLMYNRIENKYYVGQTRYMPFFRWQEHIKEGGKGSITDITFSVIAEVRRNPRFSDEENQEEGLEVFNIANPRLTIDNYKRRFNEMLAKQNQLSIF